MITCKLINDHGVIGPYYHSLDPRELIRFAGNSVGWVSSGPKGTVADFHGSVNPEGLDIRLKHHFCIHAEDTEWYVDNGTNVPNEEVKQLLLESIDSETYLVPWGFEEMDPSEIKVKIHFEKV